MTSRPFEIILHALEVDPLRGVKWWEQADSRIDMPRRHSPNSGRMALAARPDLKATVTASDIAA